MYTVKEFKQAFPEFAQDGGPPSDMIEMYLGFAEAHYGSNSYLGLHRELCLTYTAHLISSSPGGVNARLNKQDGTTIYSERLKEILRKTVDRCLVI